MDFPRRDRLQLGQDGRGVRSLDTTTLGLLGVGDLAVVDDEGVAAGPLAHRPAELLGELGLCVGREHLVVLTCERLSLHSTYTVSLRAL